MSESQNYLVYSTAAKAQAASEEVWTRSTGAAARSEDQVTQRWDIPRQRLDGLWVIAEHPDVKPVLNPPNSIEPYDPEWFAQVTPQDGPKQINGKARRRG